jgi:hypothetical protein
VARRLHRDEARRPDARDRGDAELGLQAHAQLGRPHERVGAGRELQERAVEAEVLEPLALGTQELAQLGHELAVALHARATQNGVGAELERAARLHALLHAARARLAARARDPAALRGIAADDHRSPAQARIVRLLHGRVQPGHEDEDDHGSAGCSSQVPF